jgi:hypothetical protein
MSGDAFDDIAALRINPADSAWMAAAKPKAKPKWRRRYIRVPWSWVDRLKSTNRGTTCRLALLLIYESWRSGGRAIRLTNVALAEVGISRRAKGPALEELERFGLIKVARHPRKSPLVTLVVDPRTDSR